MSFVKIAEISQDHGGQTVTHELYQEGGTALGNTLKVVSDPIRRAGEATGKLLDWRRKTEVTYQVKDDGKYLIGLFAGTDEADFRLDVKKGGTLYNRLNVVLGTESVPKGLDDPVIKLTASDGIPRLKSIEFDVAVLTATYPNGITVAELFQELLSAVGHEIPVRVYLEAQHDDQNTTRPNAHGIRWPVRAWLEGEERRSYYDVLQRACEYYQAQVMQAWGEWMIFERSYRGGPMDYANCDGSITKVTGDDRQIAIGDAAVIRERATDIYLQPISRVVSRHKFSLAPFRNARFQEWSGDSPLGWEELGAGVTQGSANGLPTAHVDTLNAGIKQESQDPVSALDRIDVIIDVVIDYTPSPSATVTADLATIRLTNTTDGQDYWLDKDGNWQTFVVNVEHDLFASSDSFVLKIINTKAPVGGTLVFSTLFDPNPDGDGNVDFDAWDYVELGYEVLRVSELTNELEYEATNTVETTEPDVEEEFGVGDFETVASGASGASEYLDASSGTWEYTTTWGGTSNFHRRRAIQRLEQQNSRLKGLDIILSADTAFTIADTMVYGEDYIPIYEEENLSKRTRRIVAYELRSDAANADPKFNPQPAPKFRPNPRYSIRLEYASEDTFDVYLDVGRDAYSQAIEWEYEVGGSVVSSGTTSFGDSPFLNILVNSGNALDRDDSNPTVRAWAWSDFSGGSGQGIRQARIFEQVLTPFLDGIPDVSYNLIGPEYSNGYLYKVAYTGDPDTQSVQAIFEQPAGTPIETTNNDGRVGTFTVNAANPLAPGSSARIKLRGYAGTGATGTQEVNETIIDVTAPQLQSGEIADGAVLGNHLAGVAQSINTNLEFFPDATNQDYLLRWQPKNGEASITLEYMDGTSYVLSSGSVDLRTFDTGGGDPQRVYIYFDPNVSTTELQFTTNYNDVLSTTGRRKFLGFAERATDADEFLFFVPAEGGSNGIVAAPLIFAAQLQTLAAKTGTLEVDETLTMGAGGSITNANGDYTISASGIEIDASTLFVSEKSLRFGSTSQFTLWAYSGSVPVYNSPDGTLGGISAEAQISLSTGLAIHGDVVIDSAHLVVGADFEVEGDAFLRSWLQLSQITAPGTTADRLYNDGGDLYWNGTQITGGAGGLTNAYTSMTDGTTTANASGGDAFKFRASSGITVTVGSNDATHGDNLLIGLDTSGDWTGTFDGLQGTGYLARSNHTGTQGASTITSGTFGAGDYVFPAKLTINGDIVAGDGFTWDTSDRSLQSKEDFYILIDSNNNDGATRRFSVRTNATTAGAATELFYVHELNGTWVGGALNVEGISDFKSRVDLHGEIRTDTYSSGLTGWRVTNAGEGDFRSIESDELIVKRFIADTTLSLAASTMLSESMALLEDDFTIPTTGNSTTISVETHDGTTAQPFANGTKVRIRLVDRSGGGITVADVWGTVTAWNTDFDGTGSYTFTTDNDGGVAASVVRGGTVINGFGTAIGTGVIEHTVIGSDAPKISIQEWTGTTSGIPDFTEYVRVGNLSGAAALSNGTTPSGYGFYAKGNTYLEGEIVASSGEIGGWTIEATRITSNFIAIQSGGAAHIRVGDAGNAAGLNSGSASGDVLIWAGSSQANRGTAPFRVTAAGAVTATDADITGGLDVTDGITIGGTTGFSAAKAIVFAGDIQMWAYSSGMPTWSSPDGTLGGMTGKGQIGGTGVAFNCDVIIAGTNDFRVTNDVAIERDLYLDGALKNNLDFDGDYIEMKVASGVPAAPAANHIRFYMVGEELWFIDSGGNENKVDYTTV